MADPEIQRNQYSISIIIPTYNRADALKLTLTYLEKQTLSPNNFEVIVIDDGSTDRTAEMVSNLNAPFRLQYFQQGNKGAAAARNLGAQEAQAEILLFLDADVVPDENLIQAHLTEHAHTNPRLVVGRVKTWKRYSTSSNEQVIDPDAVSMDYGEIARPLPFYMLLGGNFSVRKTIFRSLGGFDEKFPSAGAEETEFAYRALNTHIHLFYQPAAIGYHNHPRSLVDRFRQQQNHMHSMALLISMHPELQTEIFGVDELMPLTAEPRSLRRIYRRLRSLILGNRVVHFMLVELSVQLDRYQVFSRFSGIVFWRAMAGSRFIGFRAGLKKYGLN